MRTCYQQKHNTDGRYGQRSHQTTPPNNIRSGHRREGRAVAPAMAQEPARESSHVATRERTTKQAEQQKEKPSGLSQPHIQWPNMSTPLRNPRLTAIAFKLSSCEHNCHLHRHSFILRILLDRQHLEDWRKMLRVAANDARRKNVSHDGPVTSHVTNSNHEVDPLQIAHQGSMVTTCCYCLPR